MKNAITIRLVAISLVSAQFVSADDKVPEPTPRDTLRVAAQEICPVSGKKLNAQGKAIKTKIGAEELFLCCEKCTRGRVNPDHWKSVHANLKTAQATCPIMGKKLPPKSKWTIVNGQIIYVCCPPCTQKIKADATESLKRVAASYRLSVGRQ